MADFYLPVVWQYTSLDSVNQWLLVPFQHQQKSPIWGAMKKETLFSTKQLNCDRAQLWRMHGCGIAQPWQQHCHENSTAMRQPCGQVPLGLGPSPTREFCSAPCWPYLLCASLHCAVLVWSPLLWAAPYCASFLWPALVCSALHQQDTLVFQLSQGNTVFSLLWTRKVLSHWRDAGLNRQMSLPLIPDRSVPMQMRPPNPHSLICPKVTVLIGQESAVLVGWWRYRWNTAVQLQLDGGKPQFCWLK